MTYPAIDLAYGSDVQVLDDLQMQRATNGALRGRSYYAGGKVAVKAVHSRITTAEKNELLAFYQANKNQPFVFVWVDGTPYTVVFTAAPKTTLVPVMRWDVEMKMEQV